MPDKQEAPQPLSLADAAAAYGNADKDVQALEREREGKAAQLADVQARLDAAKAKRDQAHAGLRGAL